jgi:hypothetical protein
MSSSSDTLAVGTLRLPLTKHHSHGPHPPSPPTFFRPTPKYPSANAPVVRETHEVLFELMQPRGESEVLDVLRGHAWRSVRLIRDLLACCGTRGRMDSKQCSASGALDEV